MSALRPTDDNATVAATTNVLNRFPDMRVASSEYDGIDCPI
jgi:hypothetical protein